MSFRRTVPGTIAHRRRWQACWLSLCLLAVLAALPQAARGGDLMLKDGRPFCQAFPCDLLLPEADGFRASPNASLPVLEALKGGEVFAYLFLSTDLVNIPGYSGKPLVTLVAMDPKGVIIASTVVEHHEPILLVGIPETVLDKFLGQYKGRDVAERETVAPPQQKPLQMAKEPAGGLQPYMITGATVTALVLEETLFTSSREVARALGLIERQASRRITWKADYVEKSWQELVEEGSIGHLRIDAKEMDPGAAGDKPWIDLYFGDLTPPVVGVNILGESTYDWLLGSLKEGEKAIFVVANGISSFKGSGFVRGGIFDRFHIEQGLDKFTFKDLDYENLYGVKAIGAPKFAESGLFFLRDRRFDSTRPWDFFYLASRLTGETARSKAFKTFSTRFHLPGKYYDVEELAAPRKPSLVARIWRGALPETLLLLALILGTMAVFFLRRVVTRTMRRLEVTHVTILIASVVVAGIVLRTPPSVTQLFPFVRVFDEGFRFGLFLSDPLIFIFWIAIAVSLLLWGRGWFCGWLCPYGSLLELVYKVSSRVLPKKALYEFPAPVHNVLRRLRYAILIGLLVLAVVSLEWAERLAEIEPFKTTWIVGVFNREWYLGLYWWALLLIAVFNFRFFCRYLCPLGAALSIGSVFRLIGIKRKEYCTRCKICARGCQSKAINTVGEINRYECLYCMECEEKYYDDQACPPLIIARRHAEKLAAGQTAGGFVLPPQQGPPPR